MNFLEYVEGKLPVVTMDFDHNLMFETGEPNMETVNQFKELQQDYDVYIVTTQIKSSEKLALINKFLSDNGLKAKDVFFTNGKLKTDIILSLGSTMHFDDDEEELEALTKVNPNIKVIHTFNKEKWDEYFSSLYDDDD